MDQQGCRGIRGPVECQGALGVVGGLGAQPDWAPVQGPNTPTGRGVGGVGCEGALELAGYRGLRGSAWVRGCQEVLGASRGVRHQGASRGVGVFGAVRGCQRVSKGCGSVRGALGWTGGPTTLAPVQGPSTPTGSPWGVTYLTKARQVTEMSSAACYIHLALHLVMVCTFVSMPSNHIFLHAM